MASHTRPPPPPPPPATRHQVGSRVGGELARELMLAEIRNHLKTFLLPYNPDHTPTYPSHTLTSNLQSVTNHIITLQEKVDELTQAVKEREETVETLMQRERKLFQLMLEQSEKHKAEMATVMRESQVARERVESDHSILVASLNQRIRFGPTAVEDPRTMQLILNRDYKLRATPPPLRPHQRCVSPLAAPPLPPPPTHAPPRAPPPPPPPPPSVTLKLSRANSVLDDISSLPITQHCPSPLAQALGDALALAKRDPLSNLSDSEDSSDWDDDWQVEWDEPEASPEARGDAYHGFVYEHNLESEVDRLRQMGFTDEVHNRRMLIERITRTHRG